MKKLELLREWISSEIDGVKANTVFIEEVNVKITDGGIYISLEQNEWGYYDHLKGSTAKNIDGIDSAVDKCICELLKFIRKNRFEYEDSILGKYPDYYEDQLVSFVKKAIEQLKSIASS